jgi:ABC-type tungstate transport system permease subunit
MTTQHTPGPWEVEVADSLYNTFYIVNESRDSDEVDQANARLIAAAPELLAALQDLVSEADHTGGSVRHVSRYSTDVARAAIAKAIQP